MLKSVNVTYIVNPASCDLSLSVNQLIEKVDKLIAENESLKSEIGALKSYSYDPNSLGFVAESQAEYHPKPKKK